MYTQQYFTYMDNKLHMRVILERRETYWGEPYIFQFLLPAESFQAAKWEGENRTEPAGLPGLRKPGEHSERTKQGIHRAEDEKR